MDTLDNGSSRHNPSLQTIDLVQLWVKRIMSFVFRLCFITTISFALFLIIYVDDWSKYFVPFAKAYIVWVISGLSL